jgi:heterodisulfide reductase subunit B
VKYAYYPGCSLHASAREYDISWRAVCDRLDIELTELDDWSCCGTVHATSVDRTLSLALAARNLTIAEQTGLEVVAPCNGCHKNLRTANQALKADTELQTQINASLPRPFKGSTIVRHPLYIIVEDIGLDAFANPPRPLEGLKVAPYYGCVLTRPASSHLDDDPESPTGMDRLFEVLGAQIVPYPAKTKCCGGAVLLSHPDVAVELTGKLLVQAKELGAQCLAVACPMCQMALDAYQSRIARELGEQLDLPVLYFTQLMGVAMGIDERQLGLGQLFVSPTKVLAQV